MSTDRKTAVLAVLAETYHPEGVDIWWNARQKRLAGLSASEIWESGDEVLMQRVEALAESLTGQVAT